MAHKRTDFLKDNIMNEPKLVIIGNFFPNVPYPNPTILVKIKSRPVGYIIIVGLIADD